MIPASVLVKNQKRHYGPREYTSGRDTLRITATVRHDDECGNGHNTFSITANIECKNEFGRWREYGGCCHEEIAKQFPELAPFIKWHLMGTNEPMHYVANTIYHASDRDYRGLLKGEKRQLRNGRTNKPVWVRVMRDSKGEEVGGGSSSWVDAEEKPAELLSAAWEPVWIEGEGKARELDHARSSAVWPDATDEQLTQDPAALRAVLLARLPALMLEFKAAVESLGLVY